MGRSPKDQQVTLVTNSRGYLKLEGQCGECGTKMHRQIKEQDLFIFRKHLTIHQPHEVNRRGSPQPSYHPPLKQEIK